MSCLSDRAFRRQYTGYTVQHRTRPAQKRHSLVRRQALNRSDLIFYRDVYIVVLYPEQLLPVFEEAYKVF